MLGLSFLSPLFLIGAAAAAIPIVLHLFYRTTDPVIDFAAMRFLQRVPVEHAGRRRLKEWLLLALRAAAVILLAVAFARPYVSRSAAAPGTHATVVLLDRSASMSAPGQMARARQLAGEALQSASRLDSVAVVAFGNGVDVLAPLSQDRSTALAALERVRPGAGGTGYAAGLERAAELIGDRPGRIVIVTDLQQSGWDDPAEGGVASRIGVELKDVGSPAGNVAITSLRPDGAHAVAVVRNFSPKPATADVTFAIDGHPVTEVTVALAPHSVGEARAPIAEHSAGSLSAAVADPDGYAADNVRYFALDSDAAFSVLAVTNGGRPAESFYLERALAIAEGTGGFRFRSVSGRDFAGVTSADLAAVQVVVILGTRGLERRGRELLGSYVQSGGGLLLAAGPDVEPRIVKEALGTMVRTSWRVRDAGPVRVAPDDSRHPVFRVFGGVGTLGNVVFDRVATVEAPDTADVLARYTDGTPALVEERAGAGRVLVFASDLNRQWNDFPLQPAFVPFVHETMRYLAAARTSRTEYLVGQLPGAIGAAPGVVRLGADEEQRGRRVAINVDPRESDPARMTDQAFRSGVDRLHSTAVQKTLDHVRSEEDDQRLWQYALLAMTIALLAEGSLGRRLA